MSPFYYGFQWEVQRFESPERQRTRLDLRASYADHVALGYVNIGRMGEQESLRRFHSGQSVSLGWSFAMQEVHHKLPMKEQKSFYAAGLPAQPTASVVASGRVAKGHASSQDLPEPSSDSYYLAWGIWFAYGAFYDRESEPQRSQPYFVSTGDIVKIAAERRPGTTEVRLISDSGTELLALSLTGDPMSANELAEILDAPITWT